MLTIALLFAFAFARSGSTHLQKDNARLQRTNTALLQALASMRGGFPMPTTSPTLKAEKAVGSLKKMNEECMNDWECESDNCDWRVWLCQPCGDRCAGKAVGAVSSQAVPREHSVGGISGDVLVQNYACYFDNDCSTGAICMKRREHELMGYCIQVDVSHHAAALLETSVGGVPAEMEHQYKCTSNSGCKMGSICVATSGDSYCVDVVTNSLGWGASGGGVPAQEEPRYVCTSNSGCKMGSICATTSGSSYCVSVVTNCLGWSC